MWPLATGAQQRRVPTIGYLSSNPPDIPVGEVEAFKEGLAETGIVEGRDVAIDYRFAAGNYDRLTAFAAELVAHNVDVIAASGAPAASVVKSATTTIPIVFTVGIDPVAAGLVRSLRDPGGNLTGVTQLVEALAAKQLQLLHELAARRRDCRVSAQPEKPELRAFEQHHRRGGARPGHSDRTTLGRYDRRDRGCFRFRPRERNWGRF